MSCATCTTGFPTANQRACVTCDTSSGLTTTFSSGFTNTMTWSGTATSSSTTCACGNGTNSATSVVSTVYSQGKYTQRCVACPGGFRPNPSSQQCVLTDGTTGASTAALDLQYVISSLGLGINFAAATQANFPFGSVSPSVALATLLGPSARACLDGQDRAACNAVANLCVLQMYNSASAACKMYDALITRLVGTSALADITSSRSSQTNSKVATGPLPWLYYSGNSYSTADDMNLKVQFAGGSLESGSVSSLTFMLSMYALNGTWLGFQPWNRQMQLCGMTVKESTKWLRFGWNYDNSCDIGLQDLMAELPSSKEPVFFDLYIQTSSTGLYPVPVKVRNYDTANGNKDDNRGAVRRFFYVDGSLGTEQGSLPSSSTLRAVQYPTEMKVVVTVQEDSPSSLLPPTLFITYSAWRIQDSSSGSVSSSTTTTTSTTTTGTSFTSSTSTSGVDSSSSSSQSVSFRVEYNNPGSLANRFWYAWRTILIVFEVLIGLPLLGWRFFQYMRKRRGDQADQDLLLFTVATCCDVGSLALCAVLAIVSLYYLIIFKLQEGVYFLMLRNGDVYNFWVTVVLAIVGQTVGMLYKFYSLTKVDVFFLDWERPRKVLSKDGSREEDAPVSAWRTLMVANEYHELLTIRVTNPAFTWLMMVLILVANGVINSGNITPDAKDYTTYTTALSSRVLRFGVGVAFLLVLFLGQYLFKKLIWYPYVSDPLMNWVDLMYLANTSCVLFEDTHQGYYIHGRNHSQHSDGTLRDLNSELDKEGEGLVSNRGLVTSYSNNQRLCDNQLFRIYITDEIRRQYEQKMLRQAEQVATEARLRKGQVVMFLKGGLRPEDSGLQARDQVSYLFRSMIEEVERNHPTQVIDPTFSQMVFQLPPEAAMNNTVFIHDYGKTVSTTMMLGNEFRVFLWEALFFLAIDMSLTNTAASAFITWLVSEVLTWLWATACKNNLSDKTMVDSHFLI